VSKNYVVLYKCFFIYTVYRNFKLNLNFMNKLTVLTVFFLMPLNGFYLGNYNTFASSTSSSSRCQSLELFDREHSGGGVLYRNSTCSNSVTVPIDIGQIESCVIKDPKVNFFEGAFITETDHVYCPQSPTLLTKENLQQIIEDVKDLTSDFFLPPNAEFYHQQSPTTMPISLQSAEIIYSHLLEAVPAEIELKHLTDARIQDDNIFIPSLSRIITKDRLRGILRLPKNVQFVSSVLPAGLSRALKVNQSKVIIRSVCVPKAASLKNKKPHPKKLKVSQKKSSIG